MFEALDYKLKSHIIKNKHKTVWKNAKNTYIKDVHVDDQTLKFFYIRIHPSTLKGKTFKFNAYMCKES